MLIERRIGLLFAVFLGMLVLAGARAGWLGIVRANTLQSAAATQQKADIVVPARRGTISDANGIELAISKPAQTIAATPYLIDKPAEVAAQLSRHPAPFPRTSCCASSCGATPASSTSPAASRPGGRCARRSCTSRGSSSSPSTAASTRATGWRRSCSARSAPTAPGSQAWSTASTTASAAATASAGSSATRSATRSSCARPSAPCRARTCGSRSTPTSRTTPRRCSPRSASCGSRRARRRW